MQWCFKDGSPKDIIYANSILEKLNDYLVVVPNLWHLEVANVLVRGELKKWITKEQRSTFIDLLNKISIKIDEKTAVFAVNKIMEIALTNSLSSYDAAYLELAHRLDIPLATLDKKMQKVATNMNIELL